jgi:hypothetical protein
MNEDTTSFCRLGRQMLVKKSAQALVLPMIFAVSWSIPCKAQPTKNQSENALAAELNPDRLMHSSVGPVPSISGHAEESVSSGTVNVMTSPRPSFAGEMQSAKLPSQSERIFSSVEISNNRSVSLDGAQLSPGLDKGTMIAIDVTRLRTGGRVNPATLQ